MSMTRRTVRMAVIAASLGLMAFATPAMAQQGCGNGKASGNPHCGLPDIAQTPELGSLALLGSGLLGAGGYTLMRLRAGRRQE